MSPEKNSMPNITKISIFIAFLFDLSSCLNIDQTSKSGVANQLQSVDAKVSPIDKTAGRIQYGIYQGNKKVVTIVRRSNLPVTLDPCYYFPSKSFTLDYHAFLHAEKDSWVLTYASEASNEGEKSVKLSVRADPVSTPLDLGKNIHQVQWKIGDKIIKGELRADNNIDPDPPIEGQEIFSYAVADWLPNKLERELKRVYMKVARVDIATFNQQQFIVVKVDRKFSPPLPRHNFPVYRRLQDGSEKLFGFWGKEVHDKDKDGLETIISVHSGVFDWGFASCAFHNNDVYLEWFRSAFCSAEAVDTVLSRKRVQEEIASRVSCTFNQSLGRSSKITNNCTKSQVLNSIENIGKLRSNLDQPVEGQYCSDGWRKFAESISQEHYSQHSCPDAKLVEEQLKKIRGPKR